MAHRNKLARGSLSIFFFLSLLHCVTVSGAEKKGEKAVQSGHDALCQLLVRNVAKADTRALTSHVIGQSIDMNSIKRRLEIFTGVTPQSDGLVIDDRGGEFSRGVVRRLLFDELKELGYEPAYEVFGEGANVVATIKGTKNPDEIVEVTAHYDSVGNPGADDNGSGFTLVMELARLMKMNPPEKSVRFVLMDLEEQGFKGSQHHAGIIKAQAAAEDLIGVLVLDTIAWGPKDKDAHVIVMEVGDNKMANNDVEYKRRVEFAKILMYQLQTIRDRGGKLNFSVLKEDSKPSTADHGPYWQKGLPAVLIGEAFEDGLITPEYHKPSDTLENLNWDYYTEVARIVAEMLAYTASSRLPDNFQLDENLIAALAAKDDPKVRPSQALPEALDLDPFLPPKPKYTPPSYSSGSFGGYYGSTSPSSAKISEPAETVLEWANKQDSDEYLVVSVAGKKHSSFLAVNLSKKPKFLDIAPLTDEELIEVADEMWTKDVIYAYVTPKTKGNLTKDQRVKLAQAVINNIRTDAKDDDYVIEYGTQLDARLIPLDEFETKLDMVASTLDYLTGRLTSGRKTKHDATILILDKGNGKLAGGLVTRDLDDIEFFTMKENTKEEWKKLYKKILEAQTSLDIPSVITIKLKDDMMESELRGMLPYLWSPENRAKTKWDLDYTVPDLFKGITAGKK